jgi:excisionase family DNA binding protein
MRAKGEIENNKNVFLTLPEVQAFLGIKSRKTVLKYITTGKLRAYKIGGTRWRVAYEDVMGFLKAQFVEIEQQTPKKKSSKVSS